MPLDLFYTMVQKSQKWPKLKSTGGGGSCLKCENITGSNWRIKFRKKGFRCTIGSGRKFKIRGAPSEKQTEPDKVGGRSGWKDDWIPLSDEAGGFSLALKVLWGSAEILMEFLHHVRPGKHDAQTCSLLNIRSSAAGRMEQLPCGRWHPQCIKWLSSTVPATGRLFCVLTWLAQKLQRHTLSKADY